MKRTGVVRRIDHLGRIALPVELRRAFNIQERGPLEISMEEDCLSLRRPKARNACMITGIISKENRTYGQGLILSPEGANLLLNELSSQFPSKS